MKTKTLLSILALTIVISAFGQKTSMELTFTAKYNGQYISLDSIYIENLTQELDTTLYTPDTVLVLDYVTGVGNNVPIEKNTFYVSQNYPNPFKRKTEVNLYLPERDDIKITIRDLLGIIQVQYENILNKGNHSFTFYSGNNKYYLLTITGKRASQTIKLLNTGSQTITDEKCKIVYSGNKGSMSSFKSQRNINNFLFNLGDHLRYTGYTNTIDTVLSSAVIDDNPQTDMDYEFSLINGLRCTGEPIIIDIDSNIYNTVQIGDQCWMAENLKTTTYRNGIPIQNVTANSTWQNLTTGAYAWFYNDISWKDSYGALYNWYATVNAGELCPAGWHTPTNDDWTVLTNFIGGTGSSHGNELKSCRQVNSLLGGGCNTYEHPRWDESDVAGTDNYGFSGLPGGARTSYGYFSMIGEYGSWWSSTMNTPEKAWARSLNSSDGLIFVFSFDKRIGYSVRCVRDFLKN